MNLSLRLSLTDLVLDADSLNKRTFLKNGRCAEGRVNQKGERRISIGVGMKWQGLAWLQQSLLTAG